MMTKDYEIINSSGQAKRAALKTPHGTIQTPVFMNVATAAAIKGGLCAKDLDSVGCQVALCNTYHLHLRPGDELIASMDGLHGFMNYNGPILTDSGGFQVFSLSSLRRITDEGVYFSSHIDGRKIFMGPIESMQVQYNLGADIVMAFDECPPAMAGEAHIKAAVERTTRWLHKCITHMDRLNSETRDGIVPTRPKQLLFGINQGGIDHSIRVAHAKEIAGLDMAGYAIGGLAVGESHEDMYNVIEAVVPHLPKNKPTYLMGVGTPENILEAVDRGIDFFDCVLPARNGRHAHVFTKHGKINLLNARHEADKAPIDKHCNCFVCQNYSRAYLRHLHKAKEILAMRLCVIHNLHYYNSLMADIRRAIEDDNYANFKRETIENFRS